LGQVTSQGFLDCLDGPITVHNSFSNGQVESFSIAMSIQTASIAISIPTAKLDLEKRGESVGDKRMHVRSSDQVEHPK